MKAIPAKAEGRGTPVLFTSASYSSHRLLPGPSENAVLETIPHGRQTRGAIEVGMITVEPPTGKAVVIVQKHSPISPPGVCLHRCPTWGQSCVHHAPTTSSQHCELTNRHLLLIVPSITIHCLSRHVWRQAQE